MINRWLAIGVLALGGAMRANAATIGKLALRIPPSWRRDGKSSTPRPDGSCTVRWTGAGGKELTVDFWPGLPPTPGGPMAIARRHAVSVAGQKTEIVETSLFQGQKARVLAVFLQRGAARYRIVARNISIRAFETILSTVVFVK